MVGILDTAFTYKGEVPVGEGIDERFQVTCKRHWRTCEIFGERNGLPCVNGNLECLFLHPNSWAKNLKNL